MNGEPSPLADLLADCKSHGIRLALTGDGELTIDAPQDALTPERLDRLKSHKAALLAILRPEPEAAPAKSAKMVCRWCGADDLEDVNVGVRCRVCRRFAWWQPHDGSLWNVASLARDYPEIDPVDPGGSIDLAIGRDLSIPWHRPEIGSLGSRLTSADGVPRCSGHGSKPRKPVDHGTTGDLFQQHLRLDHVTADNQTKRPAQA